MPLEIIKLTANELEALPRFETVFIFPVASLESHGPHLPMGMDLLEADDLSWRIARRLEKTMPGWKAVLFPAAPLGVDTTSTQSTITVRAHVLRDWLVDASRSLIRQGFKNFVCVSGNLAPKQLTSIEEAGKMIRNPIHWIKQKHAPLLLSANSTFASAKDALDSPFWLDTSEHGGKTDTSIALTLIPDLVGSHFKGLPEIHPKSSRLERISDRILRRSPHYWGNPASADKAFGEKTLEDRLNKVFPELEITWKGAPPRSRFRSWYSILPPNRSFFKAWAVIALAFLIFILWTSITFKYLVQNS